MKATVTAFGTSLHQTITQTVHLLSQVLFLFWTAFLTYRNGPYYTLLEVCRNYQIFGYRKLIYEEEFKTPLEGRTCVITGGTRGIGLEVVRFLFSKGATIVTGTSTLPADASPECIAKYKAVLLQQILQFSPEKASLDLATYAQRLVVLPLDLTSMSSVVNFASQITASVSRIDYLVNALLIDEMINQNLIIILTDLQRRCHVHALSPDRRQIRKSHVYQLPKSLSAHTQTSATVGGKIIRTFFINCQYI